MVITERLNGFIQYSLALEPKDRGETPVGGHPEGRTICGEASTRKPIASRRLLLLSLMKRRRCCGHQLVVLRA